MSSFPLRLTSTVVRGFGRGSTELGIPTANLSREEIGEEFFDNLETGIYYGYAGITGTSKVYKAAISIGYNPTYSNNIKTCEPHLIANEADYRNKSSCGETQMPDFYGATLRLSVIEKIRDELPFESVEKLIIAIKNDIKITEEKLNEEGEEVKVEREWCLGESST
ncbi:hypothetical protein TrLO_g2966 [Triparma laevis f. longispina]|uniref:riboflavin kinase n=1 Tax=Triparma laevis f. longispina TaxID=1714387 RepID=A0A9W6ZYY7_9STRA|nr:hypothetical protein TrLO_g2966 [Triparma laevis f. longispina]